MLIFIVAEGYIYTWVVYLLMHSHERSVGTRLSCSCLLWKHHYSLSILFMNLDHKHYGAVEISSKKKRCTGVSINYPYWLILILEFFLKKNIPNVWFQKISMPPPRREWEIREGGGVSSLRSADAFPVIASLPPKNSVCEPEQQNDFHDVNLLFWCCPIRPKYRIQLACPLATSRTSVSGILARVTKHALEREFHYYNKVSCDVEWWLLYEATASQAMYVIWAV